MTERKGHAGGIPDLAAKTWRLLRRAWHQRARSEGLDTDQIEHRMLVALYRRTARDLDLTVSEMGRVLCIAGRGKRFRVWRTSTEFDHGPLWAITEDKPLTKALFAQQGFQVPEGRAFDWRDREAGVRYACSLGRPCVVKPASDTCGGTGVTINLTGGREIRRAFRVAGLFAPKVLIEEFIPGDNYRFLIYKRKCVSVLRRELPGVTGDGSSTLRNLAEQENRNRIQASEWKEGDLAFMPLRLDSAALEYLKRQGMDWSYKPKRGERVQLSGSSSFVLGCTYREVMHETHPEQIRISEQAAAVIDIELAGLDMISADITAAPCHIIEINNAPGLEIHYLVRNTEAMTDPIRTILTDCFGRPERAEAIRA